MEPVETDPNFEPQQRARSNTWPLPRPDNYVDKDDGDAGKGVPCVGLDGSMVGGPSLPKKNSSRRNAWGNMSYADLITQAIQSSPEKRLTLSQIYDWMVQNVPYFKDKGDSNSSAGWKNSIRHNLSLHNRFMRVQNEGTGKSSWWMINPDAKPGKAARRRATSMETQKYEKRRGRVKKKVEALRNGLDATPSPSSSISESLDMFPESPGGPIHPGFQLSPDFRPRASSNASSCGGRLSPIPAVEGDQGPPLSPLGWSQESMAHLYGTDQLVDSLAETMKIGGGVGRSSSSANRNGSSTNDAYLAECSNLKTSPSGQLSPHLSQHSLANNGFNMHATSMYNTNNQYGAAGAGREDDYATSYAGEATKLSPIQRSPQRTLLHDNINNSTSYSLQALSPAPSVHSLSPPHSMDTQAAGQPRFGADQQQQQQQRQQQQQQQQLVDNSTNNTLLPSSQPQSSAYIRNNSPASRLVATSGFCALSPASGPHPLLHPHQLATNGTPHTLRICPKDLMASTSKLLGPMPSASQMMGHLMAINSGIPNDIDLSIDSFQSELECDVDQVIRHELSVDGNLDFNFAEPQSTAVGGVTTAAATTGHHWVH